jgi:hypothetical protein
VADRRVRQARRSAAHTRDDAVRLLAIADVREALERLSDALEALYVAIDDRLLDEF